MGTDMGFSFSFSVFSNDVHRKVLACYGIRTLGEKDGWRRSSLT
jgi:hypothetical protein